MELVALVAVSLLATVLIGTVRELARRFQPVGS